MSMNQNDLDAVRDMLDNRLKLSAAAPRLLEALLKIANGNGIYGAQASEYKEIARCAVEGLTS